MLEFDQIKTPVELYEWMRENIKFGYLDKFNQVHTPEEEDFDAVWRDVYIVENHNDVLTSRLGNCWDQVEFERTWFLEHGYEVKTIFEMFMLDYVNPYPTHSFLIFKDQNKWCWFENSDVPNGGVHTYDSIEDLLNDQLNRYINFVKKEYHIKSDELSSLSVFSFSEPKSHLSVDEYLEHVTKGKRLR